MIREACEEFGIWENKKKNLIEKFRTLNIYSVNGL